MRINLATDTLLRWNKFEQKMKSEMSKDVYHCCIIVSLQRLLIQGEDSAKLIAKQLARDHQVPDLENDFFEGAKLIAAGFKQTEDKSSEILKYSFLYIKFIKKYNPDFSKKTFLNRTFRGDIFQSKEVNNLDQARRNITVFFLRCIQGVAEPDWFS